MNILNYFKNRRQRRLRERISLQAYLCVEHDRIERIAAYIETGVYQPAIDESAFGYFRRRRMRRTRKKLALTICKKYSSPHLLGNFIETGKYYD